MEHWDTRVVIKSFGFISDLYQYRLRIGISLAVYRWDIWPALHYNYITFWVVRPYLQYDCPGSADQNDRKLDACVIVFDRKLEGNHLHIVFVNITLYGIRKYDISIHL